MIDRCIYEALRTIVENAPAAYAPLRVTETSGRGALCAARRRSRSVRFLAVGLTPLCAARFPCACLR